MSVHASSSNERVQQSAVNHRPSTKGLKIGVAIGSIVTLGLVGALAASVLGGFNLSDTYKYVVGGGGIVAAMLTGSVACRILYPNHTFKASVEITKVIVKLEGEEESVSLRDVEGNEYKLTIFKDGKAFYDTCKNEGDKGLYWEGTDLMLGEIKGGIVEQEEATSLNILAQIDKLKREQVTTSI